MHELDGGIRGLKYCWKDVQPRNMTQLALKLLAVLRATEVRRSATW